MKKLEITKLTEKYGLPILEIEEKEIPSTPSPYIVIDSDDFENDDEKIKNFLKDNPKYQVFNKKGNFSLNKDSWSDDIEFENDKKTIEQITQELIENKDTTNYLNEFRNFYEQIPLGLLEQLPDMSEVYGKLYEIENEKQNQLFNLLEKNEITEKEYKELGGNPNHFL